MNKIYCPDGCPCPQYNCYNENILALHSQSAVSIDTESIELDLSVENEVYASCSVTWNNQLYILGGLKSPNQVQQIENCSLKIKGKLPFKLRLGTCTTVNYESIVACFDYFDKSACYKSSTGPIGLFESLPDSTFTHREARIAAINDTILAVGSATPLTSHSELLSLTNSVWQVVSDYPFHSDIRLMSLISFKDAFYVFGGLERRSGEEIQTIAKFDGKWSEAGRLKVGRYAHSAILFGSSSVLVVGGVGNRQVERCTLFDGEFDCINKEPRLDNWSYYPEMFLVHPSFCK